MIPILLRSWVKCFGTLLSGLGLVNVDCLAPRHSCRGFRTIDCVCLYCSWTFSMNEKEDMTNWGHRRRPVYFFQDRWLDRVEMDCPRGSHPFSQLPLCVTTPFRMYRWILLLSPTMLTAQPWEIPLSVDKLVLKLEDEDIIRQLCFPPLPSPHSHVFAFRCLSLDIFSWIGCFYFAGFLNGP